MPKEFPVPELWASRGWRFKIRDKERVEPPHVSVFHRTRVWRFGLREGDFLDEVPPPREVPKGLLAELRRRVAEFGQSWDELYPENPVSSIDHDDA